MKQSFGDPLVDCDLDLRDIADALRRVEDGTRQRRHAKAAHVRQVGEREGVLRRVDLGAASSDVSLFPRHGELPALGDDVGASMYEERRDVRCDGFRPQMMGNDAYGLDVIGEAPIGESEESTAHGPQVSPALMMVNDVGRDMKALRRREVEGGLADRSFPETLELGMIGATSASRPGRHLSRAGEAWRGAGMQRMPFASRLPGSCHGFSIHSGMSLRKLIERHRVK